MLLDLQQVWCHDYCPGKPVPIADFPFILEMQLMQPNDTEMLVLVLSNQFIVLVCVAQLLFLILKFCG